MGTTSFEVNGGQVGVVGNNHGTVNQITHNYPARSNPEGKDLLKHLRVTDPRDDKTRIEQTKGGLLQGSYCWILDNADFRRWRDEENSRLLWIKGDPGKGKTMLLCGIVNELSPKTKLVNPEANTLLSYFFCQATDERMNNATAVLRGLVYLLAKQQPALVSHVLERYKDAGKQLFEDENAWAALSGIFESILGDPSLKRIYLIIDALDECVAGVQDLLKLVIRMTSSSPAKWIVSSRNWPDIEERLETAAQKMRLSLELNKRSITAAVDSYIQHQVKQLAQLKTYDNGTRDAVQRHLSSNANDTFLWVALVCQELENIPSDNDPIAELSSFPPGLDSLYGRMMKLIHHLREVEIRLCYRILGTVMVVYRPITLAELRSLVKPLEDAAADAKLLRKVKRLCGSFLTIREGTIYFVHQSAKDYLSDKAAPTIFPSGRADAHRGVFLRSLDAMCKPLPPDIYGLRKPLQRDIYDLRHPGISIDDVEAPDPDPLASVRYSCIHWVEHLCEAQHRDDLLDGGAVHKFVQGFLLYWMEALSLCKAISDGVFAIAKLERLLKNISNESGLLSLTIDAHRFLLQNGSLLRDAPLQAYVSALLFTRSEA